MGGGSGMSSGSHSGSACLGHAFELPKPVSWLQWRYGYFLLWISSTSPSVAPQRQEHTESNGPSDSKPLLPMRLAAWPPGKAAFSPMPLSQQLSPDPAELGGHGTPSLPFPHHSPGPGWDLKKGKVSEK